MKTMRIPALLVACATSVSAAQFNFDAIPSGSFANAASADGTTFEPAHFDFAYDSGGEAIPGTQQWRVDPAGDPVVVVNPALTYDRPPAPSPDNALDGLFHPILVILAGPANLSSFRVTLDNDELGEPLEAGLAVQFLDAVGNVVRSVPIDQTVPGFLIEAGALASVSSVLLPAGALYDNLSYAPVPEPEAIAVLTGLALLAGSICRRRRA